MTPPARTSTSPPRSARTALLAFVASLAAALLPSPACAPGGSGGGNLAGGADPGGEEEPGDVEGGGLPDAFLVEYAVPFGFGAIEEPFEPLVPTATAAVASYSIAPELPIGLTLDLATGTIAGLPSVSSPRSIYAVTATGSLGSVTTEILLEVAGHARFAYAPNSGDSTISIYSVEAESGRLRHRGYHVQPPFQVRPELLIASPDGRHLFTANESTATIGSMLVDSATGMLAVADTDAIGHGPYSLVAHPASELIYVLSNAVSTLRTFRIDPETGALEQVGSSIFTEEDPVSLMIAPDGRSLAVVHRGPGKVVSYLLDPDSGVPQQADELLLPPGSQPVGGAIGVGSDAAYVTARGAASVMQIAIDPETAALELGEIRPTEIGPGPLALHPSGRFAYVPNESSPTSGGPSVSVYEIDISSGELSFPTHLPLARPAHSIGFSPDGRAAYFVDDGAREVARFAIEPETGLLTAAERVRARHSPVAIAVIGGDAPVRARATHLYAAGEDGGDVATLQVDPLDGRLTPLGAPVDAGEAAVDVEVDLLLRFLWVADAAAISPRVLTYALGSDGLPSPLGEVSLGLRPRALAAEPSARFLYVATDDVLNQLLSFAIQPDGALAAIDVDSIGFSPAAVEADPTGQFLYVVHSASRVPGDQGDITTFAIDRHSGELTEVPPQATTVGGPACLAFSPGGDRAYSGFANADLIATYDLIAATGNLDVVMQATQTGNQPMDVVLSPTGRFAYAAILDLPGAGRVELYDVRAEDGVLYDVETGELHARALFGAGLNPLAVELDPMERNLYVLNRSSATVSTFSIAPEDGTAGPIDLDATGLLPSAMALSVAVD